MTTLSCIVNVKPVATLREAGRNLSLCLGEIQRETVRKRRTEERGKRRKRGQQEMKKQIS